MKLDEETITKDYESKVDELSALLMSNVYDSNNKLSISGWVFEQVIYDSIKKELGNVDIQSQVRLLDEEGKPVPFVKVDLMVDNIYIELKAFGLIGKRNEVFKKYNGYREKAEANGCQYFILSGKDTKNWKKVTKENMENVFFLDDPGGWKNFIEALKEKREPMSQFPIIKF
jgi:hypothetical protein